MGYNFNGGVFVGDAWDKNSNDYKKGVMKLRKWHEQCAERRKKALLEKLKQAAKARKARANLAKKKVA